MTQHRDLAQFLLCALIVRDLIVRAALSAAPKCRESVPKYMTQFQNFIKNKQVKIQRKLKYFLKGYEMPFQFSSLLQVVLKIVSLK